MDMSWFGCFLPFPLEVYFSKAAYLEDSLPSSREENSTASCSDVSFKT